MTHSKHEEPSFAAGIKVMISHSSTDARIAVKMEKSFKERTFKAWTYEVSLRFGNSIKQSVEQNIRDCDVLIVLLSPSAIRSKWVARELGLAVNLQTARRRNSPHVIGVIVPPKGWLPSKLRRKHNWRIPLRDYHTKNLTGQIFDFDDRRCLMLSSPDTDNFETLVQQITPEVRFFGEKPGDSEELPDGWVECYEELFPIEDERDDPHDIMKWMEQEAVGGPDATWQTLFSTMSVMNEVVGLGYFTLHKPTGWVFGNYFGIRRPWRQHLYADIYLKAIRAQMIRRLPEVKGILFEVEPFKVTDLGVIAAKLEEDDARFLEVELGTIRSLRRLNLYEIYGARALVMRSGAPAHYRQPAMTDERDGNIENFDENFDDLKPQECELILLFYPIHKSALARSSPEEAIRFLYDVFFMDAYGSIPGYSPYLRALREEILYKLPRNSYWGSAFPREGRKIITRAKSRLKAEIDL